MEYLVVALTLLAAVAYAVFLAVNVGQGKTWAVEVARAISLLDTGSVDYHLREKAMERPLEPTTEALPEAEPEADRLAA